MVLKVFVGHYSSYIDVITTEFCTCHDSNAVMACAKFYCDGIPGNFYTRKLICGGISRTCKPLVKWHQCWSEIYHREIDVRKILYQLGYRSDALLDHISLHIMIFCCDDVHTLRKKRHTGGWHFWVKYKTKTPPTPTKKKKTPVNLQY